ncbi:MAG: potassium-transporting ATPase subunit KdpA [Proteobacteria bacterium]|nr:potassium-transporting ATPase subunit KdpA [Pseudomonadota bacterium]
MSLNGLLQCLLFWVVCLLLIKPLGSYMARVYSGQLTFMESLLGPIEDFCYKFARIDPNKEMNWQQYACAVIISSLGGFLLLFLLLVFQAYLPLNPEHFPNISADLAFNISASFITNTNWQSYAGESTLSYFSQMFGLTVQNFLCASMGMAVAVALIRGFVRKNTPFIGNFWVDWMRGILYILLPLSLVLAIVLGSQGVIQNFNPSVNTTLIESAQTKESHNQKIPGGPVASQIAIKQLGTNGGGFFNANSAHPFENPTPLSNFLELLAIVLISTAFCYTFGVMVNDKRQGWALLIAMTIVYIPLTLYGIWQEQSANPLLSSLNIEQSYSPLQSGGNMEGKEVRFGIVNSALWASTTTATSNGSVNSMHDSYTPLGGLVPLTMMLLGEVIFGGVGSGLYGILIFVFVTVFIAGLMVGRTPEYLGKKIQTFEIKMASLVILIPALTILFGTAIAVLSKAGLAGIFNPGPQGFSEILYALTSSSANNGSAFAGINANTPFYNTLLGIIMLLGRYWIIIPVLAIAGAMAQKNNTPTNIGTMSTHTPLFILFLVGVIILVGLLTFVPTLMLAPISEYFQLVK